jgi:hypothetical protein
MAQEHLREELRRRTAENVERAQRASTAAAAGAALLRGTAAAQTYKRIHVGGDEGGGVSGGGGSDSPAAVRPRSRSGFHGNDWAEDTGPDNDIGSAVMSVRDLRLEDPLGAAAGAGGDDDDGADEDEKEEGDATLSRTQSTKGMHMVGAPSGDPALRRTNTTVRLHSTQQPATGLDPVTEERELVSPLGRTSSGQSAHSATSATSASSRGSAGGSGAAPARWGLAERDDTRARASSDALPGYGTPIPRQRLPSGVRRPLRPFWRPF